jgi:hypothetical protein
MTGDLEVASPYWSRLGFGTHSPSHCRPAGQSEVVSYIVMRKLWLVGGFDEMVLSFFVSRGRFAFCSTAPSAGNTLPFGSRLS